MRYITTAEKGSFPGGPGLPHLAVDPREGRQKDIDVLPGTGQVLRFRGASELPVLPSGSDIEEILVREFVPALTQLVSAEGLGGQVRAASQILTTVFGGEAQIAAQTTSHNLAINHRDCASGLEQLAFHCMTDRGFPATGQTGQQYGGRLLPKPGGPLVRGHGREAAWGPGLFRRKALQVLL